MTDLLTPEFVREIQKRATWPDTDRLCRDYLILWDRNKELDAALQRHIDIGEYRD